MVNREGEIVGTSIRRTPKTQGESENDISEFSFRALRAVFDRFSLRPDTRAFFEERDITNPRDVPNQTEAAIRFGDGTIIPPGNLLYVALRSKILVRQGYDHGEVREDAAINLIRNILERRYYLPNGSMVNFIVAMQYMHTIRLNGKEHIQLGIAFSKPYLDLLGAQFGTVKGVPGINPFIPEQARLSFREITK